MELRIWLLLVLVMLFSFAVIVSSAAVIYLARRVRLLESLHGIGANGDVNSHPHTCTRPN